MSREPTSTGLGGVIVAVLAAALFIAGRVMGAGA